MITRKTDTNQFDEQFYEINQYVWYTHTHTH